MCSGGRGSVEMESCPTCRAPHRGGETCRRCGTELGSVLAVEADAGRALALVRRALRRGDPAAALASARRACQLHRESEALRLRAVAAVACGTFAEALAAWKGYRGGH